MENIILIGHGSPKKDADNMERVGRLLHVSLHPGCDGDCVKVACLRYGERDLMDAIKACVLDGATRIIIHPYFLTSGVHVSKDIPGMIDDARRIHPRVEFICTEPLGFHEKLVQVVIERIKAATAA